jgi:anti-anti-sigma factor
MEKKPFANFKGDCYGGITSALISIPPSIAYGIIAFSLLGPEYVSTGILAGLYCSIFAGLAAALLGTPAMITGAGAATTLIFVSVVSQLTSSHYFEFGYANPKEMIILLAFFTVFLSGLFQFFFGVLRLGNILKFVPYPVVAGFINGSAILIIISQVNPLLGIQKIGSPPLHPEKLMSIEPWTLSVGLITALSMWYASRALKKIPAPIVGLAAGTLFYYLLKLVGVGQSRLSPTLGAIPVQLPLPRYGFEFLETVSSDMILTLAPIILPAALSLAILGSLDSLLASAAIKDIIHTSSDDNRELLGQGVGNMLSAGFGGLSGSSSMVRSLPNINAGGRTALSGVVASLFILAVTIFLAPVMEKIPYVVMAGIMLIVGIQLVDKWTMSLFKKVDVKNILSQKELLIKFLVIFSVVFTILIFNLIAGVVIGVAISIFIFVAQMSKSLVRKTYLASAIPSRTQRDERVAFLLSEHSHTIAVLELEGVLFFGSADQLDSKIRALLKSDVKYIILDMKKVRLIDSSGVHILMRIYINLLNQGKHLGISYIEEERRHIFNNYKGTERRFIGSERTIWKELEEMGFIEALGKSLFFPDTDSALNFFENLLLQSLPGLSSDRRQVKFGASAVFRGLNGKELQILKSFMEKHSYKKMETVFKQGDEGKSMYYILKGLVNITIDLAGTSRKKRLFSLSSGTIFGEIALLDDKPRSANVEAVEETVCYKLSRDNFETLKKKHPNIVFSLMKNINLVIVNRLRIADQMIEELES